MYYFINAISNTNDFISKLISAFNLFFTASPHPNHVGRACLKLKVYVRPPGKSCSNYTHTHTHTHTYTHIHLNTHPHAYTYTQRPRLPIKVKLGGIRGLIECPGNSFCSDSQTRQATLWHLYTLAQTHTYSHVEAHTSLPGRGNNTHRLRRARTHNGTKWHTHFTSNHITLCVRETFCPCKKITEQAESAL